jgi:hypothetical protein
MSHTDLVAILIGLAPPTILAGGALLLGWLNSRKLIAMHIDINSRLTTALQAQWELGKALGLAEGLATIQNKKAEK